MKSSDILSEYSRLLCNKMFLSFKSNRERIEFILTRVKPLHVYREEIFEKADNYYSKHRKWLRKSLSFRAEGRLCFQDKDYESAIFCFTKFESQPLAILNTPFESEDDQNNELSLAYASRSVVFFEMKDYENALFDANHSIELNPTVEMLLQKIYCLKFLRRFGESKLLIEKIIKMAENYELDLKNVMIEELLELKRIHINFSKTFGDNYEVKVESESGENFWIHPSVQIRSTPQKGRHFIAKEFIPRNTIVIIEKPYSVVLFDQNILNHCNYCHKDIGHQIWPCIGCNQVVFCNQECAEEAMDKFHKYECGITGMIHELGSCVQHVFRIFAEFGCFNAYNCEKSVEQNGYDIKEYLEDERQQTIPENYKTKEEKITEYKAVSTLLHHNNEYDKYVNIYHTFTVIEAAILLNYSNALDFDVIRNFDTFIKITDLFIVNIRRILTNVFGWFEYPNDSTIDRNHVGNSHCFIASLMNHSCDPNTYWSFVHKNITFKTSRNINAGEEINDSYGPTYWTSFEERQKRLKRHYFFTCNCEACLLDAKSVPALQCLKCDGPVIYKFKTRNSSCLKCGENYENITSVIRRVEGNRILFKRMLNDIRNEKNIEFSLTIAEKAFQDIIQLVYHKSKDLLSEIRQLLQILLKLGKFSKAVKYCKHFMPSFNAIEYTLLFAHILDDMLLCTKVFHEYLTQEKVSNKEDWETGFGLYYQLIQLLNNIETRISNDVENIEEDKTLAVKNLIKTKTKELEQLKTVFAAIIE